MHAGPTYATHGALSRRECAMHPVGARHSTARGGAATISRVYKAMVLSLDWITGESATRTDRA